MTEPFLQIQGIRKDYGIVVAVQDVTLDIARGEFMTFLGPSGSGKSTTLYILAGFQKPTGGDILLEGQTLLDRRRTSAISAWCSSATRCFRICPSARTSPFR